MAQEILIISVEAETRQTTIFKKIETSGEAREDT